MDPFRQQFEALLEQIAKGTYAQEVTAFQVLRSVTPEAASYAFNLLHSAAAEDREYGCTVANWLLHAAADEEVPILPELAGSAPIFIQLALHDPAPEVRAAAGCVLSWIKTPEVIPALCNLAEGGELEREAAAGCLAGFGPDEWQIPAYAALRPQVGSALLRLTHDADLRIRSQAVFGLHYDGHDTEEVRQRLLALLHDEDPHVRGYSARVLGGLREPRLVPILEARLRDVSEMKVAGRGYFDAVDKLGEPALLSAAEVGVEIMRCILGERGSLPHFSLERTLAKLREAAQRRG